MKSCLVVFILALSSSLAAMEDLRERYRTPFEKSDGNETATYEEAIEYYFRLSMNSPRISVTEMGATDSGQPLHLVLAGDPLPELGQVLNDKRSVLLINNAIHPGEPDGVDASMAFARDFAFDALVLLKHAPK